MMHCGYFDTTRKGNHYTTVTLTVVGGWRLLRSEICAQSDPPPFEKRRLRPISAYNISTVTDIEKSSIMMNIKSTTGFPTSYTLCLKKVPTFKLSVTLSYVNRFFKIFHCWKAREICYKTLRHYPPHLRHVATLPWEIKNANFLQMFSTYGRKCKQTAFLSPLPLLCIHKFRYFQCLK